MSRGSLVEARPTRPPPGCPCVFAPCRSSPNARAAAAAAICIPASAAVLRESLDAEGVARLRRIVGSPCTTSEGAGSAEEDGGASTDGGGEGGGSPDAETGPKLVEARPTTPAWVRFCPDLPQLTRKLRIALPCCGIDGAGHALHAAGVPFDAVFAADLDTRYRTALEQHLEAAGSMTPKLQVVLMEMCCAWSCPHCRRRVT